ncbi:hypothetical protein ACHAWU_007026 [Discostella pseudostelligera]|uniref:Ribosomal RNA-processing protein 43 n=1 Tax=Discostella pseudostelligera TaxID=259834 RepID=A0ABD3MB32_9STRA
MAASSTAHLYSQGEGEFSCSNTTSGQEWILDAYRALEPRNYLHEFTSQNVRPDGRPYSASRPITILQSIFTRNSYGSAMVTLGGASSSSSNTSSGSTIRTMEATRVIAACTILVGQPNPATPTEGDIDVTLTASPLSGPRFDIMGRETAGDSSTSISLGNYHLAGQQQQQQQQPPYSQISENLCSDILKNSHLQQPYQQQPSSSPTDVKEIESWIRRTLRSSRFINPTELGIEPGVSAWRIRVSIHIVNHEGNVWDASLLAACAALSDLRIPMVEIERGVVRIVKNEDGEGTSSNDLQHSGKKKKKKVQRREGRSLTLGPPPVPLTIAILPNSNTDDSPSNNTRILLVDPTHLEEDVASGNIVTVVCNTKEEIVEFHKKGSGSRLSMEQVAAVGCMGFGRARELEKFIIGG